MKYPQPQMHMPPAPRALLLVLVCLMFWSLCGTGCRESRFVPVAKVKMFVVIPYKGDLYCVYSTMKYEFNYESRFITEVRQDVSVVAIQNGVVKKVGSPGNRYDIYFNPVNQAIVVKVSRRADEERSYIDLSSMKMVEGSAKLSPVKWTSYPSTRTTIAGIDMYDRARMDPNDHTQPAYSIDFRLNEDSAVSYQYAKKGDTIREALSIRSRRRACDIFITEYRVITGAIKKVNSTSSIP